MGYLGHKASSGWVCNFGERVMIVCFAFYWSRSLRILYSSRSGFPKQYTGPRGEAEARAAVSSRHQNSLLCIAG